jgi:uncharacterized protein YjbI with pentapeptide repeats
MLLCETNGDKGTAMANEEHIARLKEGVAAWNAWALSLAAADLSGANLSDANLIDANLSRADLSGADLSGADLSRAALHLANLSRARLSDADLVDAKLSGADLKGADLSRADLFNALLIGANLIGADLVDANLIGANLIDADLNRAHLGDAKLGGADLTRANLIGANLIGANFKQANLSDANLTEAVLAETIFADLDLSSAIGLEACVHLGPSIIDYRTLHSSGSLPIPFLRGVGLPDSLIDYLPALFKQAVRYYSCFISYSTKDQTFADCIHADLQNKGVRCWFAPHDLPIGGIILDEIDAAVRLRDKVLLILSEQAIKSGWVKDEVNTAFEEERKRNQIVLFPIRLDDAVMNTNEAWAAKLRARNIGDFTCWKDPDQYKKGLERVLRDLAPKPKPP